MNFDKEFKGLTMLYIKLLINFDIQRRMYIINKIT